MIPRYARPEMTTLWEAESRFSIWLDIETHAMDAMVELGIVPADAAKAVRERGGFDVARIDELIAKRSKARATRDFEAADAARDALADMGVRIEDTPDGTIWRLAPARGTR